MTVTQAQSLLDEAMVHQASVAQSGGSDIGRKAAQGYVHLCELMIEYLEDQLA